MAGSRTDAYIAALQRKYARQLQPRVAQTPAFTFPSTQQAVSEPVNSFEQEELTGFDRFAAGAMDTALGAVGRAAAHIPGVSAVLPDEEKNKDIIASGLQTPFAQNVMDVLTTPLYGVLGAGRNVIDYASASINPSRATQRQRNTKRQVDNDINNGGLMGLIEGLGTFNPGQQAAQVWTDRFKTSEDNGPGNNERVTGANIIDSLAAREGPSENTINIAGLDTHIGYDWLRGGGGFAIDVLLDPLSYVTGAGALKAGRVTSMTARNVGPAGARAAAAEGLKQGSRDFARRFVENWQNTGSAARFTRTADGKKIRNRVSDAGRRLSWDDARLRPDPNFTPGTNTSSLGQYGEDLGKWADESAEIAERMLREPETPDVPLTPEIQTPNKPIVPTVANTTAADKVLDQLPNDAELGAVPEAALASKVTQAESGFDRSQIEIESPFIQRLIEETTPAAVAPEGAKPWGQFLDDSVEALNKRQSKSDIDDALIDAQSELAPGRLYNLPGSRNTKLTWDDLVKARAQQVKAGAWTPAKEKVTKQYLANRRRAQEVLDRAGGQEVADGPRTASDASPVYQGQEPLDGLPEATSQASEGAAGVTALTRLTGKERKAWLQRIRNKYLNKGIITKPEFESLKNAKTEEEFFEALTRIKGETPSPIVETPVPANIDEAAVPLAPAYQTLEGISAQRVLDTDGSDLTPIRDAALKDLYTRNLNAENVRKKYPHKSGTGVPRTHKTPGVGAARHREYINSGAQTEMYDFIWKTVRGDLTDKGIKGLQQDAVAARQVARISKSVDDYIKSAGGVQFIGQGRTGPALSMSDIMPVLMQNPRLSAVLTTVDMRASTAQIADAVEAMLKMKGATPEGRANIVRDILAKDVKKSPTGSGRNSLMNPDPNGIGTRQRFVEATGYKAPKGLLKNIPAKEVKKWLKVVTQENLDNLTNEIVKNYDNFLTTSIANRKRHRAETGRQSFALTNEQIENIGKIATDPLKSNSEFVDSVVNVHSRIEDAADEMGANAEAVEIAHNMVDEAVTEVVPPAEMARIDHQMDLAKNFDTAKVQAENIRYAKQVLAARQLFRSKEALQNFDLFVDDAQSVVMDQFFPGRAIFNSSGLGHVPGMADIMPASKTVVHDVASKAYNDLHVVTQKYNSVPSPRNAENTPVADQISLFDDVASVIHAGNVDALSAFPREAVDEIQALYNEFVGLNSQSLMSALLDNRAFMAGVNYRRQNYINTVREVGYKFNEDIAILRVANGRAEVDALMSSTRTKLQKSKKFEGKKVTNQDVFDAMMKDKKIRKTIDNAKALQLDPEAIKRELASQWQDADIPARRFGVNKGKVDYGQFLVNQLSAQLDALTEVAVSTSMYMVLERAGALSKTYKPGWVKISKLNSKGEMTALGSNLPEGLYFHPDTAQAISKVESMLNEVYRSPSMASNLISKWVMPFLDTWKTGMTFYRPGHHIRNGIGDLSLSQAAGRLRNPKYFRMAHRVNQLNGGTKFKAEAIAEKQASDAARSLEYIRSGAVESYQSPSGTPVITIRVGGAEITLTDKMLYDAAKHRGILQQAHIRENLMQEADQAARTGAQRREKIRHAFGAPGRKLAQVTGNDAFEGGIRRVAVKGSEVRDHTIRLAHFLEFVEKEARHYSNVRDLFDDAASEVRKWHPDGSGMTLFENRVLRPIVPFYSWMRKAIPLVAESALVNPARFMLLPKAMYAIATTQGIDLEGYGNPFPQDQLFPSFLRERALGPTFGESGSYIGVNPGFAHIDVLNQFSGAPVGEGLAQNGLLQGTVSSLNPALRLLPELISGTNMSTGAPISDWSDYLDMQTPGLNILNSAAGFSTTGALGADMWMGGDDYSAVSRNVERGLKKPFLNPATLNLLLGLGITDMSQPNYINLAEIEQRNGRVY